MAEEKKKLGLKGYMDALVDKDGLRTEVTITLTSDTLIKTSLYLVGTAFIIILMVYSARAVSRMSASKHP